MFGLLLVGSSGRLVVFDSVGSAPNTGGKGQSAVFRQGTLYVRREGQTQEARQSDVDRLVSELVARDVQRFVARVEYVASVPLTSDLVVRNPGSSEGFLLVGAGKGIPVHLDVGGDGAVPLQEVLTADVPLASVQAEVVAQVRQWRAEPAHRVRRPLVGRWYLERGELELDRWAIEFCFLSSLNDWGFPMFWASRLPRERLRELVTTAIPDVYPGRDSGPYLVGAFFFQDRAAVPNACAPALPRHLARVVQRLLGASSVEEYSLLVRQGADRLTHEGVELSFRGLVADPDLAGRVFESLIVRDNAGHLTPAERVLAHRLDFNLHCDSRANSLAVTNA